MTRQTKHLAATTRAARLVAGVLSSENSDDSLTPLREARQDGQLVELVLALALRCVQLAEELHGDNAQTELDSFAFDALAYEQRHRGDGSLA